MGAREAFRQVGPDQFQVREGGGCLSLFGLPFFLAGIFVALIGVRVVPVSNAADVPAWAWPLIFLMGLAFVAVGGGLIFGRRWITLDRAQNAISKRWGLLVPMRGETHSLRDYEAVVLRFDAGDSDTADRYPVVLKAKAAGADFSLSTSTQYGASREGAAAVAKFLALPLVDAATDHESVITADQVDATFQERLRAGDGRREEPVRPLRVQSQVRESSSGVEIVLPGPGFRRGSLIGLVVSVGLLTYVAPNLLRFFRQTSTPEAVQIVFFGVIALFLVLIPLRGVVNSAVLAARGRTVVTASAEGVAIEVREAWRVKTTRIAAADILGLDYGTVDAALQASQRLAVQRGGQTGRTFTVPGKDGALPAWLLSGLRRLAKSKGIIVKCRNGLVPLGAGLPDEEIRYLYALVARALGGTEGRRW
jgi:hypothetical protein